eukprot:GHVH01002657.1.p1 GENE.GHVH01002657.1~~GHVH01002657.1.p1  ORF type:complete len:311 (+),score=30.02 GHVH01002657.1:191-1123(+)
MNQQSDNSYDHYQDYFHDHHQSDKRYRHYQTYLQHHHQQASSRAPPDSDSRQTSLTTIRESPPLPVSTCVIGDDCQNRTANRPPERVLGEADFLGGGRPCGNRMVLDEMAKRLLPRKWKRELAVSDVKVKVDPLSQQGRERMPASSIHSTKSAVFNCFASSSPSNVQIRTKKRLRGDHILGSATDTAASEDSIPATKLYKRPQVVRTDLPAQSRSSKGQHEVASMSLQNTTTETIEDKYLWMHSADRIMFRISSGNIIQLGCSEKECRLLDDAEMLIQNCGISHDSRMSAAIQRLADANILTVYRWDALR